MENDKLLRAAKDALDAAMEFYGIADDRDNSSYTRTYKYIQCRNCMAQSGIHGTEQKARKSWNTRAPIMSAEELEAIDGNL